MDLTKQKLEKETIKWKKRIEKEIKGVNALDENGKELLENINAYVKDSAYFTGKDDSVRAFEAVIWAWAVLEVGKKAGLLS